MKKTKKENSQRAAVFFLLVIAIMGIITLAASVGIFNIPDEGLLSLFLV